MLNTSEYIQWRTCGGDLTPWNYRSRISNPAVPDELYAGYELENVGRLDPYAEDTPFLPTTLAVQDGRLTCTYDNGQIILMDKNSLQIQYRYLAHSAAIFDLKWRQQNTDGSPNNGRNFITASGDRSIVFWDAERCSPISTFHHAHNGSVKTLSFHDANLFASGGRDGIIKMWDLRSSVAAIKCGPEFTIENSHCNKMPTIRKNSRSIGANKKMRQSPISSRVLKNVPNLPSNVVTSVQFKPQFKYHLYSSGVSDNAIKMWDIRRCKRQYQFSKQPVHLSIHSIRNCSTQTSSQLIYNVNNHGFRQLSAIHSPKFGNILLASSSNNRIYVFVNDEIDPVLAFTGCKSSLFTKMDLFQDKFLLSGSIEGKIFVWNLYRHLEEAFISDNEENIVPSTLPCYYYKVANEYDDITCVSVDQQSNRFYHVVDDLKIYQWSLFSSKISEERIHSEFNGILPKCEPYICDDRNSTTSKK